MTGTADVLRGIAAPADLWDEAVVPAGTLDGLVYRSNLLGSDRALANQGGGNTSAKGAVVDHAGRETPVLWVKGSGTDLATITAAGFAALRLDELLPLRAREVVRASFRPTLHEPEDEPIWREARERFAGLLAPQASTEVEA